ncbi:MAG: amidophosphoribosyltransferase [Thermaerobacter sp.]|jgi:amidophosphoribosyltransferase|nr:amidophosphoribosyltransferase [Thermaerobacter sp.]
MSLREECGVAGVWDHPGAGGQVINSLYALQHRGQESAGLAVTDGRQVRGHKGMGLVAEVFSRDRFRELAGAAAIGHVRYSTTGASLLTNAQPLVVRYHRGGLALAHNGNLVNARRLRERLEEEGSIFQTTSDTEVVAHLIARAGDRDLPEAAGWALEQVEGAYALLMLSEDRLLAARDPAGIRPLSIGRLGDTVVFASETCALDALGAVFWRDVAPGEMVVAGREGLVSYRVFPPRPTNLCAFEFIYFARPDSDLDGMNVHAVRKELGRALFQEAPVEADLVTGVPDSSISAAAGYAEAAGIPYELGLVKNRYIGRTFIQPGQDKRSQGVRLKLNALRKVLEGRRVVLVDDSIVRGTTSRHIVQLLRDSGAREVHLRISSPPYRYPCFYGIDTSATSELVAAGRQVEDIRQLVGADSLAFLSSAGLLEVIGTDRCMACFTGEYPVRIPAGTGKHSLEERVC